jgi:hypothetical protein
MADTIKTSLGPCVDLWARCHLFVRLLDLIMFELWFFGHRLASVHIHVIICRVCVRNKYLICPMEQVTTFAYACRALSFTVHMRRTTTNLYQVEAVPNYKMNYFTRLAIDPHDVTGHICIPAIMSSPGR